MCQERRRWSEVHLAMIQTERLVEHLHRSLAEWGHHLAVSGLAAVECQAAAALAERLQQALQQIGRQLQTADAQIEPAITVTAFPCPQPPPD